MSQIKFPSEEFDRKFINDAIWDLENRKFKPRQLDLFFVSNFAYYNDAVIFRHLGGVDILSSVMKSFIIQRIVKEYNMWSVFDDTEYTSIEQLIQDVETDFDELFVEVMKEATRHIVYADDRDVIIDNFNAIDEIAQQEWQRFCQNYQTIIEQSKKGNIICYALYTLANNQMKALKWIENQESYQHEYLWEGRKDKNTFNQMDANWARHMLIDKIKLNEYV